MSSKSKKILITGGAGFIGYHITKELLKKGHEVIIYDAFINFIGPQGNYAHHLSHRLQQINKISTIIRGDIRNGEYFLQTLKKYRPQIIIHLAAIPISSASNKFVEDAMEINLDGMGSVIKAIGAVDFIERIVYASSSFVYGNFQYSPADEKHPTVPIDVYGATKLAGENLIKGFGTRFDIPYNIIRPSTVYGPTGSNLAVSQILTEQAVNNEPLALINGKNTFLDFTYVEDAAQGFVLATLSDKVINETFNITRGKARSIQEFADILKKYFPNLKIIEKNIDEKRPKRGTLDISKARKYLGYNPKYSLEKGIKKYIDFLKKFKKTTNKDTYEG